MVYYDPDNVQLPTDPDEVQCTRPMWRKFVRSAPSSYANSLAVIDRKSEEAPTVDEVAGRLQQYEESLSSSLVSAVEKLSQDVRQLKEDISYSPPVQTRIAAVRTECRPQFAFTWRGIQYTWNRLPQGWKHSPTICHGLIQTALEQGEAPEHLQYIDDIIVWGNSAEEVSEKGKKIFQILLQAGFAIRRTGENGPTWSLWQKAPGETRGRPLGFWSRGYRGSEARYTPTEKEILAAYEGVRAASEVIGTEAQLLLAPRLPVLGWMFKERAPSTHHATDATWNKWVALITQQARIGNPNRPGILEVITDWPEGKDFGMSPEEEVTRAEEAPPYNKLTEDEKPYALFTDGSCRIVGKH
ncbi:hypothetical protein GRJ2_003304800 [Grus japonensis]|uniref:ribonuclease H n=1 Tax=Grus japonensis TaxID=30415 RepID=A0ABC9YEQ6_GRUJA